MLEQFESLARAGQTVSIKLPTEYLHFWCAIDPGSVYYTPTGVRVENAWVIFYSYTRSLYGECHKKGKYHMAALALPPLIEHFFNEFLDLENYEIVVFSDYFVARPTPKTGGSPRPFDVVLGGGGGPRPFDVVLGSNNGLGFPVNREIRSQESALAKALIKAGF